MSDSKVTNNNSKIYKILLGSIIILVIGFVLVKWAIFPLLIIALMIYFAFRNPIKNAQFYTRYDNPELDLNKTNNQNRHDEELTCVNCGSNLEKNARFCSKCGYRMRL